jgi:SAM-dependent methyltransferase
MAEPQDAPAQAPNYALGHAADKLDRLIEQGRFIGELTEHVLRLAGLGPGMRVLDVGCGAGDVTFLAARLVGPEGVDRSEEAIAVARERARGARLASVHFIIQDTPVDALVGRLVLAHLAEPAATLHRLLANLRPGAWRHSTRWTWLA